MIFKLSLALGQLGGYEVRSAWRIKATWRMIIYTLSDPELVGHVSTTYWIESDILFPQKSAESLGN